MAGGLGTKRKGDRVEQTLRQTGRTTAMLQEADLDAAKGRKPFIIVHEQAMVGYCMSLCGRHGLKYLALKNFYSLTSGRVLERLRGLQYRDIWIDHAVYDIGGLRVDRLLEALERMRMTWLCENQVPRPPVEDPWCWCGRG